MALMQVCLLIPIAGTASAQFEIGGAGGRRDNRIREESRHHRSHRGIGTGIGIGVEIGTIIQQGASQPRERTGSHTRESSRPKRAAKKDDKDKKGGGGTAKDKKKDPQQIAVVAPLDDCLLILHADSDEVARV
jgi:hypothetical protein